MSNKTIQDFESSKNTRLAKLRELEVTDADIDDLGNKEYIAEMITDIVKYTTMIKQRMTFINSSLTRAIPFTRENLYLICAYSGNGKSTICANISYPLWKEGKKTLVISNEESKQDVLLRIACVELGYNFNQYKKGQMPDNQKMDCMRLLPVISKFVKVMDVSHKNGMTTKIEGVKNALEAIKGKGFSCAMIDYFQLIQNSEFDPRKTRFEVLNEFKTWVGQYIKRSEVPVVLFAQLHSVAKRSKELDNRIKDCPAIYEPSTVVIEVVPDFKNRASDFIIRKDRFGLQGTRILMGYDEGRFVNYTQDFQLKIAQQLRDEAVAKNEHALNNNMNIVDEAIKDLNLDD